ATDSAPTARLSTSTTMQPPTVPPFCFLLFFFTAPATTEIYTLSLHDALPIYVRPDDQGDDARVSGRCRLGGAELVSRRQVPALRSEEHTSELQSRRDLVCRLLLEKKKPPS